MFHYEVMRNKARGKGEVFLYFCRSRREVDQLVERYGRLNLEVLGCKGGEVDLFLENLKNRSRPQVIFSTTCLSHGVNLPPISKVFISYTVENKDFWIQMAGRGGRRGEKYEVYTLESFEGPVFFPRIFNFLKGLLMLLGMPEIFPGKDRKAPKPDSEKH